MRRVKYTQHVHTHARQVLEWDSRMERIYRQQTRAGELKHTTNKHNLLRLTTPLKHLVACNERTCIENAEIM